MTKIREELFEFRKKIDQIDLKILKLLEDRMDIVQEVGKFKSKKKDKFFIKSAREADMINNLVKKSSNNIFSETIIAIWRKIITNANLLEQKIKIALHNPEQHSDYKYILKEYFNNLVPISNFKNTSNVINSLEKGEFQIAAFLLPKHPENFTNDSWWINFANNNDIKIYAKTSFGIKDKNNDKPDLVLAAKKEIEKSSSDNTLSVVEFKNNINRSDIINELKLLNFDFKILDESNISQINNIDFYLIEFIGFFDFKDKKIQKLQNSKLKPLIKIIGYYSCN